MYFQIQAPSIKKKVSNKQRILLFLFQVDFVTTINGVTLRFKESGKVKILRNDIL